MSVELTAPSTLRASPHAIPQCEWISPPESERTAPFLLRDEREDPVGGPCPQAFVMLGTRGEAAARALLDAGYGGVLVGDAAVRDPSLLERLASAYGSERVGVALRAARLRVSWGLDSESNSDFRVMRPTHVVPDWEIVLGGAMRTGALVGWWLGQMFERGIGRATVTVDIADDADLNILAGLTESFGEKFAVGLRREDLARIEELVRLCGVKHVIADWSCRDALCESLGKLGEDGNPAA